MRSETRRDRRRWVAAALMAGLLLPSALAAQVRVSEGSDGRKRLSNEQFFTVRRPSVTLVNPRAELLELIERYALQQSLDPILVRAMIQVESGYDPAAVSRKGAIGLMQLMPQTASELRVSDPYDPEANVRGGTIYLRRLLEEFDGELVLALAGYNAGPQAVRRYGGMPPYEETRSYVRRVMRLYQGADFSEIPSVSLESGRRKVYLVRRDGKLVMTTTPPGH